MTSPPDAPPCRLRLVASGGQPTSGFLEMRRTFDELQRLFLELQNLYLDGVTLAASGEHDREEWLPSLTKLAVMWAVIAGLPRGEGAETLARETFNAFASRHGEDEEPLRRVDAVLSAVVSEVHAIHSPTA